MKELVRRSDASHFLPCASLTAIRFPVKITAIFALKRTSPRKSAFLISVLNQAYV